MFFHPCRDVCQAAWDPCSYRWIIWSKWEIELCVISVEMVGEAMCLYDGTQWCSVCGEKEGSKNRSLGNPLWPIDVLWIPPLPRPPWKTDQWDRIQTSEVESQWCPVMRGWTGESDDWQCQKWQTDPAEWGLMIWNRLLQFTGLQWLRVAESQLNGVMNLWSYYFSFGESFNYRYNIALIKVILIFNLWFILY